MGIKLQRFFEIGEDMPNITKTANGQIIDMDAIRFKNETVVALGNMNVNARGDEIAPMVEVPRTRKEQMTEYYKLHSVIPTKKPRVKKQNALVEVPPTESE